MATLLNALLWLVALLGILGLLHAVALVVAEFFEYVASKRRKRGKRWPKLERERRVCWRKTLAHLRGKKVLVASGDAEVTERLVELLPLAGCDVVTAESLATAVAQLERERCDLSLVRPPFDDGTVWEFIVRLQQEPAWASIPLVLLVRHSDPTEFGGFPGRRLFLSDTLYEYGYECLTTYCDVPFEMGEVLTMMDRVFTALAYETDDPPATDTSK